MLHLLIDAAAAAAMLPVQHKAAQQAAKQGSMKRKRADVQGSAAPCSKEPHATAAGEFSPAVLQERAAGQPATQDAGGGPDYGDRAGSEPLSQPPPAKRQKRDLKAIQKVNHLGEHKFEACREIDGHRPRQLRVVACERD